MARYSGSIPQNLNVTVLGRPTCYDCFRPKSHCLCNFIEPFKAHCNTLILQHPNEHQKYYSTAKLVARAIENSRILRGINFSAPRLMQLLEGQNSYLLYPSALARDCSEVELNSNSTVIVIDGTWREAAKIIFRNDFLKTLPCLTFKNPLSSEYRIRKQPKHGCLSTLESLGHLLKMNAAVSGYENFIPAYDSLFAGFKRMINQQLGYWPARDPSKFPQNYE